MNSYQKSSVCQRTQEILLSDSLLLAPDMNIISKRQNMFIKDLLFAWQTLKEHYDSITIHCFNFRIIHHEINPVEFTTMSR